MNKNIALLAYLLLLIFPLFTNAQTKGDFSVYLNSGKIIPENNINIVSKDDEVFQKSLFGDKHYLALQFYTLPTQLMKDQLQAAGIELGDYLPNNTYVASLSKEITVATLKSFNIRSIFQLASFQKTITPLSNNNAPLHALKQSGFADVHIVTYEKLSATKIQNAIAVLNATVVEDVQAFKMFTVRISLATIHKLADLPFVQWAEFIDPPNQPDNLLGLSLHRVNVLQDGVRNLKGDGINIAVFDERTSPHLDFSPVGRLVNVDAGTAGSHGTHVSGTIGGRGIINPIAKGMAPNAKIYSYFGFSGDVQAVMSTAIPTNTLISSNHSYFDGVSAQCGTSASTVAYSLRARNTDLNINNFPYHLHCHSSGNQQGNCAGGWGTITGTGKSAKNNIVVGNITTSEGLSSSSSCGPVHDGRIKPEIVAMGTNVFSTYTPINTYGTISGTSMSTPGITGTVALLVQRYKQLNGNVLPNSALIKNIACNTARDLGTSGPDYRFGFGRINALSAVRVLEQNRYITNTVTTGESKEFTISVPAGATRLNVMITWNDPAAAANVDLAIVNSLDLMLFKNTDTTRPWILDKENPAAAATKSKDTVSNIEQVTIDNPTGTYTVRVEGIAVPVGPNQPYFISWIIEQPSIEVIYPNGNESLNPSSSETITWNNSGITGNQTIEYSIDNGATWNILSTTVAAATTRFIWTVPAANTSTALIRVSSESITDVSDTNFKILGTTAGLSTTANCTPGEISFSWNATANATHYDLLRFDATTGDWIVAAANIIGTTHTLTGLTPVANLWFSVVAKNNTTAALANRSIAINRTVSIAGTTIGTVSGASILCEATTGVNYTVPTATGANSYLWTVPTGASLISGQGTSSIIVDYETGSTSGSLTVAAVDVNGCQSIASTRAITVNALPAKPIITPTGNLLVTTAGFAMYKWYFNNVIIGGAATNSYTATANGLYKVEVTNNNSCTNISDDFNFVATSLNDVLIEGSKLSVFPNPVIDQLNFKITQQSARKLEVSIINAEGKLVKQAILSNGITQLSVSDLAPGYYLVKIMGTKETKTIKIQIIH